MDELHAFNWCQLYLEVTTLQELFKKGTTIHPYYLQPLLRHAEWQQGTWPITKSPSLQEFFLWSTTIQWIAEMVSETPEVLDAETAPQIPPLLPLQIVRHLIMDGRAKGLMGNFGVWLSKQILLNNYLLDEWNRPNLE